MFKEICINEEMLSIYTYLKLRDPEAHKYNTTLEYKRDFVRNKLDSVRITSIHKILK